MLHTRCLASRHLKSCDHIREIKPQACARPWSLAGRGAYLRLGLPLCLLDRLQANSHKHTFSLTLIPGLKPTSLVGGRWVVGKQRASYKDTTSKGMLFNQLGNRLNSRLDEKCRKQMARRWLREWSGSSARCRPPGDLPGSPAPPLQSAGFCRQHHPQLASDHSWGDSKRSQ